MSQNSNFTESEINMINSKSPNTPFRVLQVTNLQDSILLRTKSENLVFESGNRNLANLIDRMIATVQDSATTGVGIAAPQIGILKNIIIVQRFDKPEKPFEAYINPKIIKYSEMKQDCREGCLSVPNKMDTLSTRSYAILIAYETQYRQNQIEMVEGFTAVIFQHEIDHLNGVIFTDYIKL